jgi:hypothetical protein
MRNILEYRMRSLKRVIGAGIRYLNLLLIELKKRLTNEANLRAIRLFFSFPFFFRLQVLDRSYFSVLVYLLKYGIVN